MKTVGYLGLVVVAVSLQARAPEPSTEFAQRAFKSCDEIIVELDNIIAITTSGPHYAVYKGGIGALSEQLRALEQLPARHIIRLAVMPNIDTPAFRPTSDLAWPEFALPEDDPFYPTQEQLVEINRTKICDICNSIKAVVGRAKTAARLGKVLEYDLGVITIAHAEIARIAEYCEYLASR